MRWALIISVLVAGGATAAELSEGFDHFYNLEYDQALDYFQREVAEHPADPNLHNHVAQVVLFREMFRVGALESEMVTRANPFLRRPNMNPSPESAKMFEDNIATAMKLCQERIAKNPKDVQALYAIGVSYGLRANWDWLMRKAWREALRDATTARRFHTQAIDANPQFVDANLVLGIHNYLIGSLPWSYRALGFMAGIRGDREAGLKQLKVVAAQGELNRYDAQVFLAAIYRRERHSDQAIPILLNLIQRFPRNYLFRLELAQMYGEVGENGKAIAELETIERMKGANSTTFASLSSEKIDYYKGTIWFWSNQLDQALGAMKRAAPASTLDLNTQVMAWMRLGQIYDLKGDRTKAHEAYQKAVSLAPDSEPGKESKGYLNSPYRRG